MTFICSKIGIPNMGRKLSLLMFECFPEENPISLSPLSEVQSKIGRTSTTLARQNLGTGLNTILVLVARLVTSLAQGEKKTCLNMWGLLSLSFSLGTCAILTNQVGLVSAAP